MIESVVVCPHPPLLLRELGGRVDPAPELRAACHAAVGWLLATAPETLVLLGGGEATRAWPDVRAEPARFGLPAEPGRSGVPLSLQVGARLLDEAGTAADARSPVRLERWAVAWEAGSEEADELAARLVGTSAEERTGLLVLGDGSNRRSEAAPGHLDARAAGYDDEVARALREGDAKGLSALDADLGRELGAAGRAAWRVLGAMVERQGSQAQVAEPAGSARMAYCDSPFGVGYFVCRWSLTAGSGGAAEPGQAPG